MASDPTRTLSKIPSMTLLLEDPEFQKLSTWNSRNYLVKMIRELLADKRKAILAGQTPELELPTLWKELEMRLKTRA